MEARLSGTLCIEINRTVEKVVLSRLSRTPLFFCLDVQNLSAYRVYHDNVPAVIASGFALLPVFSGS